MTQAWENSVRRIAIGSDHGGFELKELLKKQLRSKGIEAIDVGTHSTESADYPDYAEKVARLVSEGRVPEGILICGTGIGMCITANKFPNVRAAVVANSFMAKMSRAHNNANILCMGGRVFNPDQAKEVLDVWLQEPFEGGRHERRVKKIQELDKGIVPPSPPPRMKLNERLRASDPKVFAILEAETRRQSNHLEMIASENFVSRAVLEAMGSTLTNKYAEGYPGKRYYSGCEVVDQAEELAIDRAKQLFGSAYVNVQPHSGSQANMGVFFSMLKPGDKILSMNLSHGGHLTHGSPVNFSGKFFEIIPYGVRADDGRIDYDEVQKLAETHKPKLILCGASAYPRIIDFPRFRKIADSVSALLMADVAHTAGLIAGGVHPSPVPHCHFVTTTTHKTLRGPRGGMIMTDEEHSKGVASQIFPGIQGGPMMHVIASKAVAFGEALQPDFKTYSAQILSNTKALAEGLVGLGFHLVSGGTDTHLVLIDLRNKNLTGKEAEVSLERAGITVNKNMVPFDDKSPFVTSGVRIGTPALTTRGMKEKEMTQIAQWIHEALEPSANDGTRAKIRKEIENLCNKFPIYEDLLVA